MNERQQSTSTYPVLLFMADATDARTGKTGLTLTVTASKNGGAFAAAAATVTELANGWYKLSGSGLATDLNTLGDVVFHASATGADPADVKISVVPWNPFDAVRSDLRSLLGTLLTEGGAGRLAGALSKLLDVAAPTGTINDLTTLTGRLTAARAGYLDNLNVGGAVAAHADILALNQSASRRLVLTSVQQYERPEAGSVAYEISALTYDGDGALVDADSPPTLTATGPVSGDLSANLSAATHAGTGLYRWTYTVPFDAELEQLRFDLAATIAGDSFTLPLYAQTCDFVASPWTTADRAKLDALHDDRLTAARADALDHLDVDVSSRLAAAGYVAPDNASFAAATRVELAPELDRLDVPVSSRLSSEDYVPSGTGVVQVLPLATSVQSGPVRQTSLIAYERGEIIHRIAVFDALGSAVSLANKALQFSLCALNGAEIGFSDSVSVEGPDQNEMAISADAAWHVAAGLFRYAVRDLADGSRVWAHGDYTVERAAGPHVGG